MQHQFLRQVLFLFYWRVASNSLLLLLLPLCSFHNHDFLFSPFHYLSEQIAAFIFVTAVLLGQRRFSRILLCFLLLPLPLIGLCGGFRCGSSFNFKFRIAKIICKNIVLIYLQFLSYYDFHNDGYALRLYLRIFRWLFFLRFPIIYHNQIFHSLLDESNRLILIYNYFIIIYLIYPSDISTRSFGK